MTTNKAIDVAKGERVREVLPANPNPIHYDVTLEPDLDTCTFVASLRIDIEVTEPVNEVQLNAHELDIKSVLIGSFGQTDDLVKASKITIDDGPQVATFLFNESLNVGKYTLYIEYEGLLNDQMAGFYASKYDGTSADGCVVKKTMAVTQFEACDARRALPCWDEPSRKATFTVALIVDPTLVAVSNMPETSCVPNEVNLDKVKRQFDVTPKMSTYLLAFVVGEFDYIEQITDDGVNIRVYTPVGKSEQGEFALDVAVKCLDFYNNYFEIKYPLPKLDLLAIPDFAAGAMENWGCVTYRSTALLVDPQNSSASTKQWVALVVAHELAHQWFGNLVTMEWWTDLWLNEGFASWVEYLAVDKLFPDWKMWTQFVCQDFGRALQLDALNSSHPVEVSVFKASEVDEIFDHISYCKGGSIIRMLVNFLGEEAFRKGMVLYLGRFAYSNASTIDLWTALGESTGKPVAEVMKKWTRIQGFPVIYAKGNESKPGVVSLEQQRFMVNGPDASFEDQTWSIPITLVTNAVKPSSAPVLLLKDKKGTVTYNAKSSPFVKLNSSQCGVYRVAYSPDLFEKIVTSLQSNLIVDPADRLGVQSDAIALSRAGLLPTSQVLTLALAYVNETNYTVWADILSNLVSEIKGLLMHSDMFVQFKRFAIELLEKVATSTGWDPKANDSHLSQMLRSLVIPQIGQYGHTETVKEACKRFQSFAASNFTTGLSPDLRSGVYHIALKSASTSAEFDQLIKLYSTASLQEEKVRVLSVLGASTNVALLHKAMEFALSDAVRKQDLSYVLNSVACNPIGTEIAWQWLQQNWTDLVAKFGSGFIIGRLITYGTSNFTTMDKASEVSDFFSKNVHPGGERAVLQSIEKIKASAAWFDRDADDIRAWLNSRYPK